MKKTLPALIIWFSLCIPGLVSCKSEAARASEVSREDSSINRWQTLIQSVRDSVETGDIIVRTGNDFTSQSLRSLNRRDKTYSHCGIAMVEQNKVFVIHALGGEWNPDQKILKEPFDEFCNSVANRGFGIFRLQVNDEKKKAILDKALQFKNDSVTFDMDFDLSTDDKMYCAEFVGKSIEKAAGDKIKIHRSRLNKFEFIGVDDILLSNQMQKIFETKFIKQN